MSEIALGKREFHLAASKACDAAAEHASALGIKVTIVVLDRTFNVAASLRMDGAYASAFTVGRAKAWTALNFQTSSATMAERVAPGNKSALSAIEPNLLFMGGGELIAVDGEVLGAVGVSGGSEAQDIEIASTAARLAGAS